MSASFDTSSLSVSFIQLMPPHPGEFNNGKDKGQLHHQPHRFLDAVSINKILTHDTTQSWAAARAAGKGLEWLEREAQSLWSQPALHPHHGADRSSTQSTWT